MVSFDGISIFEQHPPTVSVIVWKDDNGYIWAAKYDENRDKWIRIARGKSGIDDADVIQKAIYNLTPNRNWKETLLIYKDIYNINKTIKVPSFTKIVINGNIVMEKSLDIPFFINNDINNGNKQIEIIGGILDGQSTGKPNTYKQDGIVLINCEDCIINNINIQNIKRDGISVTSGKNIKVVNCSTRNTGEEGIVLRNEFSSIINNTISEANGDSIIVKGSYINIIGNRCYNGKYSGIIIGSDSDISHHINCVGNVVYNVEEYGISSSGISDDGKISHHIIISNNIVSKSKYGISIPSGGYIANISNNIIEETSDYSINIGKDTNVIDDVYNISIINNKINNSYGGILIENGYNILVKNNNIRNLYYETSSSIVSSLNNTDMIIVDSNIIEDVNGNGILIRSNNSIISNNIIKNINKSGNNGLYSIILVGKNSTIYNNRILDYQETHTTYGISEGDGSDFNIIHSNILTNTLSNISKVGQNTHIYKNIINNKFQENYGVHSITGDGTTTTFTVSTQHYLITDDPSKILVTATPSKSCQLEYNLVDNDGDGFKETLQFTLTFTTAPASGEIIYLSWNANVIM